MNKRLPEKSIDLLEMLDLMYPDKYDTTNNLSDFDRGKQAGVIELIRNLKILKEK